MDKDRLKGAIDDVAGRAKRQVGEWSGDTRTQVEGAAQQVKGKAEKALGNLKDAVKSAEEEAKRRIEKQQELEREDTQQEDTVQSRR